MENHKSLAGCKRQKYAAIGVNEKSILFPFIADTQESRRLQRGVGSPVSRFILGTPTFTGL